VKTKRPRRVRARLVVGAPDARLILRTAETGGIAFLDLVIDVPATGPRARVARVILNSPDPVTLPTP
jgi:hypothetical protein